MTDLNDGRRPRIRSSCTLIDAARGDRLKQAQADADALIAAYRLEQQDAFDASPVGDGKFFRTPSSLVGIDEVSRDDSF
jgi:hypothetical protein